MFTTQKTHARTSDVIYTSKTTPVYQAEQKIFVKTDFIQEFFQNFNGKEPYILVTGDSDYSPSTFFSDDELIQILKDPRIIEWRAQNVCFTHPKLIHLPIGLEDTPFKIDFLMKNMKNLQKISKKDEVYTNFTSYTNPQERGCFVSTNQRSDFETYIRTMASHKYVLCPMGNGIDTHRFWEAQICGCIPIIRCPKEFLPTYRHVPYISIPGVCYARLGDPEKVVMKESKFEIKMLKGPRLDGL